jgi:hypothetical protein
MKKLPLTLITVAAILLNALPSMGQQKRLSPHESTQGFIDGDFLSVVYSRPYTKNPQTGEVRKIWGGLVPYGKVWRTGANEATLFFTQKPILMGGTTIPVGGYTLYTLPAEDGTAKLIINKHLGQWGTEYDEREDFARVDLKVQALEKPVDQFTMAIEGNPSGGGVLKLMWEKTEYSVAFTVQKTGAEAALSPMAKTMDFELTILEHDLVPLAEAMPAAQYDFAPTNGEFQGVRTFGQQVRHLAGGIYGSSAAVLGETPPVDLGQGDNGPATLKTKEEIVKYLKGAFACAHRAMTTLTEANSGEEATAAWGKQSRLFMADLILWHSYDHYGQMVVYARMNGIIPPSSRRGK